MSSSDYLDRSPHASRIGKAVEHLVAASCVLATDTELNVSTAMVDDEGVDLVFHHRSGSATLAVQVRSRGSDSVGIVRDRQFVGHVRQSTFSPRRNLYMLFVVVDRPSARIGTVWLVPSLEFDRLAARSGDKRRIQASLGENATGKWRPFRMEFVDLPRRILDTLRELEQPK